MTGIRKAIIICARSYIGTPFHHQGRTKFVGVDCVGLVVGVAKSLNLFDHDYLGYAKHPDGETLTRELGKVCEELTPDEILPGDVLCFYSTPRSQTPQHIAIMAEDGDSMIHAHSSSARVVETPLGRWVDRVVCCYRYPGVSDQWQP